MVLLSSVAIAMMVPLFSFSFANPAWNALNSERQPGVNALGKNAKMTGPFLTSCESCIVLPWVSTALKSGAF
tara:strand:- start:326 stop:541 length:216 start_codon:yes stop_codon:yes gene_type:complete